MNMDKMVAEASERTTLITTPPMGSRACVPYSDSSRSSTMGAMIRTALSTTGRKMGKLRSRGMSRAVQH
jgi:hypothetical protein